MTGRGRYWHCDFFGWRWWLRRRRRSERSSTHTEEEEGEMTVPNSLLLHLVNREKVCQEAIKIALL